MEFDEHRIDRLTTVQRGFLSLELDFERITGLLAEIGGLVGADAGFAGWLDDGRPWLVPWHAGPQIETYMATTFAGVDKEGNIRCRDADLDALNRTRRGFGTGVYHEQTLAPRDQITRAAYFREAFEPAGMPQVIGMTARLSVGEAIFAFGFQAPGAPGFVSGETEAVLHLLLPSFEAGFHAIDRRNRHRERLEAAIRASPLPARLLGPQDPPDPDALLQLPLPELGPHQDTPARLSIGEAGPPQLAAALAQTFALTKRQEQVATRLLDGESTYSIAAALDVSYNTARRHCEAVLQKTLTTRRDQLSSAARACLKRANARIFR